MSFTVGIDEVLYKSLTPEEVNCLRRCRQMSDDVTGHYVISFECNQENSNGRFVYMIGNASNNGGICVKEFQVYSDYQLPAIESK